MEELSNEQIKAIYETAVVRKDGMSPATSEKMINALTAVRDEIKRLRASSPAWHDRPTGPGLWMTTGDDTATAWDQSNIERQSRTGWYMGRVFGPIPADDETHA